MAMYWYSCRNCGNAVCKEGTTPYSSGCIKGSHNWSNLGVVGKYNYSCSNCGLIIQTDTVPFSEGCIKGSHNWHRL